MTEKYILNGRVAVPCQDLMTWARWYEIADRKVASTIIGHARVSTVFLGIDHQFTGQGTPLLFETMIFGGKHDSYQERSTTWEEAERDHAAAVAILQEEEHAND